MIERLDRHSRLRLSAWLVWVGVAVAIGIMWLFGDSRAYIPPTVSGRKAGSRGNQSTIWSVMVSSICRKPRDLRAVVFLPVTLGEIVWRFAMIAPGEWSGRVERLTKGDDRWFLINSVVSAGIPMGPFPMDRRLS